ncbi:hypothetical protein Vretifemale_15382 [Volvox reticuliferus]|uniref:Uncharacterized protein n=1 Tax=Volvox reticuliferus TaxID=1737510 RepID=A0A8J4CUV7_9CHLO|nr:hypothetical protein Vretifemale_15382 [Volvox reticuliferus]
MLISTMDHSSCTSSDEFPAEQLSFTSAVPPSLLRGIDCVRAAAPENNIRVPLLHEQYILLHGMPGSPQGGAQRAKGHWAACRGRDRAEWSGRELRPDGHHRPLRIWRQCVVVEYAVSGARRRGL